MNRENHVTVICGALIVTPVLVVVPILVLVVKVELDTDDPPFEVVGVGPPVVLEVVLDVVVVLVVEVSDEVLVVVVVEFVILVVDEVLVRVVVVEVVVVDVVDGSGMSLQGICNGPSAGVAL